MKVSTIYIIESINVTLPKFSLKVIFPPSKEGAVKQSGLILRSDVFYEQEYRELCLQQLNIYNETKMSLSYLKDLVETTHVFMKLMESMSKSNHLMVKSKKKRKTADTS